MKLLIIEFLSDSCDKICKSHKMWNRNVSLPQHLHTCAINTMVSTLRTFHLYLIVFTGGKPARFIMIIIYYRVLWDNEITTYTNSRAYLSHWVGSSAGTARGCGCGCTGVPISSAASAPSRCPQPACSGGLRAAPSTLLEHTAHTTALHLQLTQ